MMPKWHILFGFVFSFILVYFFHFSLFAGMLVFLSSIFIDLDHILVYFLETKNLHPKKFWQYSLNKKNFWDSLNNEEKQQFKRPHFLFHGVEFVLLLFFISIYLKIFFYFFIGILFHILCDLIVAIYNREHISIKTSQVWLWQRNKSRKFLKENI